MSVTVVVATFGERHWIDLAMKRAIPSAEPQAPVIHTHYETLAASRNAGLDDVDTEFVIFLDADDELAAGYVEALAAGSADLRVPAVQYVRNGRPRRPRVPNVAGHRHDCSAACMEAGNYAVIGSMARTGLVRAAGGFFEEAIYEDWSLWLRMVRAGATVEAIPEAVYVAHVRPNSRNRAMPIGEKNEWHHRIAAVV